MSTFYIFYLFDLLFDDFEGDGDDGGCHDEYCTDAAAQNVNHGCVIVKVMVSIAVI